MAAMDILVQQVCKEGIVKYDNVSKKFECLICKLFLSGEADVKAHFQSKNHKEAGARFAIKDLQAAPKSLKDLLPNSVRDAALAKDVSVLASKELFCHICKTNSTGVISLDQHLCSSSHKKKKKEATHTPLETKANSTTYTSPAVRKSIEEGIVDVITVNDLVCKLCNLHFNGEVSLQDHLSSSRHREAGAREAIKNIQRAPKSLSANLPPAVKEAALRGTIIVTDSKSLQCIMCSVELSGVVPLNDHLIGDEHRKKSIATSLPAYQAPIVTQETAFQENPDICKAIKENIIIETDEKLNPFVCVPCDKKFNNSGPLVEHLKSKKHKQEEKKFLEKKAGYQNASPTSKAADVTQGTGTRGKRYSVISEVRGHVYIFNYTFRGSQSVSVRTGAELDSDNLRKTFTRMGYEVFEYLDLTKAETNNRLETIKRKPELHDIDAFIVFFLSHGKDAYTFLANDDQEMDLQMIRREFTDRKCPHLRGKPKIFFVNYCRGNQLQKREIECDSIEAPSDMATIHAATEGIMAMRDRTSGTIFVTALCKVLNSFAKESDLRDLYSELDDEMKKSQGTKPMWEDYGFNKKFYFNPK